MLNQLKSDRIAQLILAGVILAGLATCAVFAYGSYVVLSRQSLIQNIPGPTTTPVVFKLIGTGDDVVFFDSPASGPALFTLMHRGDSNFIIDLKTRNGVYIDLLVNEIGEYNGKRTVNLAQDRYMLQVTADGPWAAVVVPPQ